MSALVTVQSPSKQLNQLVISEENIVRTLNGSNIRISSDDEKNKTMIQNIKSYVFQENMKTPYVELGTFLPKIIKSIKDKPEFTKLFELFDDIQHNRLEDNLSNYIKDAQTVDNLKNYIDTVNNQIDNIPVDTIAIRGGSKRRQTKRQIKKGGSPNLQDIIGNIEKKRELNYYTIIGVSEEEPVITPQLLIYFEFNFKSGTENSNKLARLNKNINDLVMVSVKLLKECAEAIYKIDNSPVIENHTVIEHDDRILREKKEKTTEYIQKLDDNYAKFITDNSKIEIEGNIYLFNYEPTTETKAKVVAGPYKAKMVYDMKNQMETQTENQIESLTCEKFNLNLLNLYIREKLKEEKSDFLQAELARTGSERGQILEHALYRHNMRNPRLPNGDEENQLIRNLGLEDEDIDKLYEYIKIDFNDLQKIIMDLGSDTELGNNLNGTNFQPKWFIKDDNMPFKNSNNYICKIFEGVPYYPIVDGIINQRPVTMPWCYQANSISLSQLSNSIQEDIQNSYTTPIYQSIIAFQNDEEVNKIVDILNEIIKRVGDDKEKIEKTIEALNTYIENKKKVIQAKKSEIMAYLTAGTSLLMIVIIGLNLYNKYNAFTEASLFEKVGTTVKTAGLATFLSSFTAYLPTIIGILIMLMSYVSEPFKKILWMVYDNFLKKIFISFGLTSLVIDETNYDNINNGINNLREAIQSNDQEKIKVIADKLVKASNIDNIIKNIDDIAKGGSRKKRTDYQNYKKTFKKRNKKGIKNKLKSKHRLKTKRYNKTKKLNMRGGVNSSFIPLEILNAVVGIQDLFMFPENYPIYNTSSVFDEIYKIISEVKVPVAVSNQIIEL